MGIEYSADDDNTGIQNNICLHELPSLLIPDLK